MSKYKKIVAILFVFVFSSGFMSFLGFGFKPYVPSEFKPFGFLNEEYKVDGTHFVGPRGINEAFLVYKMSGKSVEKINNNGLEYLTNLPSTKKYEQLYDSYLKRLKSKKTTRGRRSVKYERQKGAFKDWRATPIQDNEERWNRTRNNMFPGLVGKGYSAEQRRLRYPGLQNKSGPNPQCIDLSLCSFYGDYHSLPKTATRSLDEMNFTDGIQDDYVELVKEILTTPNSFYGYGDSGVLILSPEQERIIFLYRD